MEGHREHEQSTAFIVIVYTINERTLFTNSALKIVICLPRLWKWSFSADLISISEAGNIRGGQKEISLDTQFYISEVFFGWSNFRDRSDSWGRQYQKGRKRAFSQNTRNWRYVVLCIGTEKSTLHKDKKGHFMKTIFSH